VGPLSEKAGAKWTNRSVPCNKNPTIFLVRLLHRVNEAVPSMQRTNEPKELANVTSELLFM
jgi:hypothetical protein